VHDGTGGMAGMCAMGLDTEAAKLAITSMPWMSQRASQPGLVPATS